MNEFWYTHTHGQPKPENPAERDRIRLRTHTPYLISIMMWWRRRRGGQKFSDALSQVGRAPSMMAATDFQSLYIKDNKVQSVESEQLVRRSKASSLVIPLTGCHRFESQNSMMIRP